MNDQLVTKKEFNELRLTIDTRFDFVGEELREIRSDISDLKHDVADLKHDVTDLKHDVTDLKTDFTGLRGEFVSFRTEMDDKFVSFREEINNDFKRHTGIILEAFDDKIKLQSEYIQMMFDKHLPIASK